MCTEFCVELKQTEIAGKHLRVNFTTLKNMNVAAVYVNKKMQCFHCCNMKMKFNMIFHTSFQHLFVFKTTEISNEREITVMTKVL